MATRSPVGRSTDLGLVLAGLVAAGVLGVVALVLLVGGSSGYSSDTTFEAPATSVEPFEEAVAPFDMTPGKVRKAIASYEAQFGTLDAFEAGFFPRRMGAQVPVRGPRPRAERWSYDGGWRQDTAASAVRGLEGTVDLGTVDVRRLFVNIATARKTLGVQGGELTHVLVKNGFNGRPSVTIHVANTFGESGHLRTTPSGDVVRAYPYES